MSVASKPSGSSTSSSRLSAWAGLIGMNLVPVFGFLFLDWDIGFLLVFYWLENAIIGVCTVPRILSGCASESSDEIRAGSTQAKTSKVIMLVAFVVHYGGFWVGHGLFVFIVWVGILGITDTLPEGMSAGEYVASAIVAPELLVGVAVMAVFHFSKLRREDPEDWGDPIREMFAPYPRVVVLHVILLGGVFLMVLFEFQLGLLLLFVLLKTVADIRSIPPNKRADQEASADSGLT